MPDFQPSGSNRCRSDKLQVESIMHNDIDLASRLRPMRLAELLAQDPTNYEELKALIEAVLERTEWPVESKEAAQDLLGIIRRKRRRRIDYSDPETATQTMRNIWQKVKQAYNMRDRGHIRQMIEVLQGRSNRGCTELLIACLKELFLVKSGAGPLDARHGSIIQGMHLRPADWVTSLCDPPPPYPIAHLMDRRPVDEVAVVIKPPPPYPPDEEEWFSLTVAGSGVCVSPSIAPLASVVEVENQIASLRAESSPVTVDASTTALTSAADIGTQITLISPIPVKVNGHLCDVFAGIHSGVGRVALKRPRIGAADNNHDIIRRFRREAETWGKLQHPHTLEHLGTFQRDGYFYFVSPFIENGTLAEYIVLHPGVNRIKHVRPFSRVYSTRACAFGLRIWGRGQLCETADAIHYLHMEGVVHGSIKASNLLIGCNGQVLLCDFGLTRTTYLGTSTAMKGAGTLRWQSPELWLGGSKSFESDVYAFGMTIAEVLTGDVPFPDRQTDGAVIRAVLIEDRRPPKYPTESSAGLSYKNVWAVAEACWPAIPEERTSMTRALQLIHADPALVGDFITSISKDAVRVNGHFCDVFEGIHSTAGRVALKRPRIGGMDDEEATIRRFEREAATWRSLRHPHILEFLGTFRRGRHLYLVSPFINNGTLVEYIARHPEANRVRLLCETADALKYLHENDVVHGDIKGGNILIDDNIHCLLCDFGLTKVTHSRTSTAMRGAGTFRWQSPELWFDAPKSFSSDAYAFAMTIVEVLTGQAPFAPLKNDAAVMVAVVNKDERPLKAPLESSSGVSYLGTWDVAEACWSKNPEERISMTVAFQRLQADPSSS